MVIETKKHRAGYYKVYLNGEYVGYVHNYGLYKVWSVMNETGKKLTATATKKEAVNYFRKIQ